jgi:hypothetical protein
MISQVDPPELGSCSSAINFLFSSTGVASVFGFSAGFSSVFGSSAGGCSVFGSSAGGCSVFGSSAGGCSVFGSSAGGCSVFGSSAGGCSVFGSSAGVSSGFGSSTGVAGSVVSAGAGSSVSYAFIMREARVFLRTSIRFKASSYFSASTLSTIPLRAATSSSIACSCSGWARS